MLMYEDPAHINLSLDSRSISFENPRGERGQGGKVAGGRKGAPSRVLESGEKVVLADIAGPGRVRHLWMTFPPGPPEQMRAMWMEVFYDGRAEPSISVPCLDFFGLPHGRTTHYVSAMTAAHEGRGFNAYFPMPFRRQLRIELTNSSSLALPLYYQIDYTLEPVENDVGYLHVLFNRENPTTLRRDFVIASGLKGPGRLLGTVVGVRVLQDDMSWFGEGEVKIYRDGDDTHPTICGTGLEDYVGTAWGLGQHTALYAGVPINVIPAERQVSGVIGADMPDFVGFYRWHLPDPIIFYDSLAVTIQQIGALTVRKGEEQLLSRYQPAGNGWRYATAEESSSPFYAAGLAERQDDYCAAAFVYCRDPQAVPRLSVEGAVADLGLLPYEPPPPRFF